MGIGHRMVHDKYICIAQLLWLLQRNNIHCPMQIQVEEGGMPGSRPSY
jgi:hypothetical protein